MISALISLLVLGGLVTALVRSGRSHEQADGGVAVRRFFQYAMAYGLVMVATTGVVDLVTFLLIDGPPVRTSSIARAVTFTAIGVPLAVFVMRWLLRQLRADEGERESFGWGFHLTAVSITTLAYVMVGAYDLLGWAWWDDVGGDIGTVVRLVGWGALWVLYWRWGQRLTSARNRTVHELLGAFLGLVTATVGLGRLLSEAVKLAMPATGELIVATGPARWQPATVMLVVGAIVWIHYWVRVCLHRERGVLWHVLVLLVGVLGGLATVVIGLYVVLFDVLVWLWGEPVTAMAARHFDALPPSVGAVVVGLLAWWYHRAVLGPRSVADRDEVERIHDHLGAGVGLAAGATGLVTVMVAGIEALVAAGGSAPEPTPGSSPINTFWLAVTLLAVGAVVWGLYWRRIQRIANLTEADAAARATPAGVPPPTTGFRERQSPTRRVYLFVIFGIGAVAGVIALLSVVFAGVRGLLEGDFGLDVLRDMRVGLAVLVTGGIIAAGHWAVYRKDRAGIEALRGHYPNDVLLVGALDRAVADQLAAATGARVRQWQRTGDPPPWEIDDLTTALAGWPDEDVLVLHGPDGIEVVGLHR